MVEINKKRLLVTTPDMSTWDLKSSLLFLGEWCRLYEHRNVLDGLDILLHPYHWDDRQKYQNDYKYLEKIYEQKLATLSIQLGKLHGVSIETRYWRIIIGPWLRFFIDAVFDRFELIRTVAETDIVDDTRIRKYHLNEWIPIDFQEFYDQIRNDPWNQVIFSECIINSSIPFSVLKNKFIPEEIATTKKHSLRKWVKQFLESYLNFLPSRLNKISIIAGYLPIYKLIKFQLSLSQFPYISSPNIRINNKQTDNAKRETIVFTEAKTPFEQLLNKLIVALIPYAYIENFDALKDKSLARFPKNPKLILTANAYQADDGFKVWAANHVEKKIPLILEQHGGHYGFGLLNQTEDHQLNISDVFATWGWSRGKNVLPMPAMKLNNNLPFKYNPSGKILITTPSYPRYFYCAFSVPFSGQFLKFMDQLFTFTSKLNETNFDNLVIRYDSDVFGWDIKNRLVEKKLNLDSNNISFINTLRNSSLSISTYNATIFLETLSMNFPTIVFFDLNLYELRPNALKDIELLKNFNIFHYNPISSANFLN